LSVELRLPLRDAARPRPAKACPDRPWRPGYGSVPSNSFG
jgi:hypothetical protein